MKKDKNNYRLKGQCFILMFTLKKHPSFSPSQTTSLVSIDFRGKHYQEKNMVLHNNMATQILWEFRNTGGRGI